MFYRIKYYTNFIIQFVERWGGGGRHTNMLLLNIKHCRIINLMWKEVRVNTVINQNTLLCDTVKSEARYFKRVSGSRAGARLILKRQFNHFPFFFIPVRCIFHPPVSHRARVRLCVTSTSVARGG